MTSSKILIIEDNVAEAIHAQAAVAEVGIEDFRAVTTLQEGLELMPQYSGVLSDLFFPVGEGDAEKYIQRFLPLYEQFKAKRFRTLGEDNVALRAVQQCAKIFGVTPRAYVDDIMGKLNTPPQVLKAARDALAGLEDSERYEKFLKIEDRVRNGTGLPLGIVTSERASELGTPCVIVTSTYHHDDAFEAVSGLIKVPYLDRMVDGKKDWRGGIELLLR